MFTLCGWYRATLPWHRGLAAPGSRDCARAAALQRWFSRGCLVSRSSSEARGEEGSQPHSCSRGGSARAGFMLKPCYRGGCSCTFWVLWTRDGALGPPRAPGAGEGVGGQAENNGQSFYYCE